MRERRGLAEASPWRVIRVAAAFAGALGAVVGIGLWRGWFVSARVEDGDGGDPAVAGWRERLPADLPTWRRVETMRVDLAPGWGLARHPDGDLVVCGAGGLRRRRDGRWEAVTAGPDLRAVACDREGRYYACSGHRLLVFAPDGRPAATWEAFGDGARLDAVAVAGERVFVADGGHGLVYRCDLEGRIKASWGRRTDRPDEDIKVPGPWFDLTWDPAGERLWVVNPGRHHLLAFDGEGDLVNTFGGASLEDPARFVGCCNPVAIAVLPGGDLVTAEKGICRVKVLDTNGVLRAIVAFPEAFGVVRRRRRFAVDVLADADGVWLLERDSGRLMRYEP